MTPRHILPASRERLLADLLAALSISGLLIPEAVAYSAVAGLPPQALAEKLAAWRAFSSHYRRGMDATLAGFDRLAGRVAAPGEIAILRESLGEAASEHPRRITTAPHRVRSAAAIADRPSSGYIPA